MNKKIFVSDKMQKKYTYVLSQPVGENFDPEFKPDLTPKEMLELGVFGGRYLRDCRDEFPKEWFEKAKAVNAPRLRFADASIDVSVNDMVPIGTEKTKAVCNVKLVQATQNYPQVYCRAMSATVEAIIHATRVKALINDKKEQKHVSKLLELIENCNSVVNRVAPNSSYSMVMADLMKRIDSWRNSK